MVYTEFDRLKEDDAKNCKKGIACGNSCISQSKKCKQNLGAKAAAVADHLSDPANLEKGAESSDPLIDDLVFFEFDFDEDLNPVASSPESQAFVENFKKWEVEQNTESNKTLAQKLNPEAPPPTEDQAEAINTYTGSMYRDINGLLRGAKQFGDPEYEKKVQDVADKAAEGLRSLPDYKGETYRGTALNNDIIEKMKVGGTYSDKGFLSTSSNPDIADTFSNSNKTEGKTQVLFTIDGKHGKDISSASKFGNEKEILFNPSSKFRITSMEEKDGILHVGMKQYGKQK